MSLGAFVEDEDGNEIPLSDEFELRVRLEEDADDIVEFDFHGDHVHITGQEEGHSAVVFKILWQGDHAEYEPPAIDVAVGHDHD